MNLKPETKMVSKEAILKECKDILIDISIFLVRLVQLETGTMLNSMRHIFMVTLYDLQRTFYDLYRSVGTKSYI